MKFSTCTIAALFVAPVVGFTVTMSSVAYLDRISSGGGLTSFAPSTPANYSPASYSAPAPAPAPYRSPFADLPASNDINYMQNLGGGNAMKAGKNYSGVSRKFTASSGLPYTAAASSTQQVAAAPAPAPYVSSFAAAPASNSLNYMGSLGGGSEMKSGKNYSGVSGSKWGPVKSTGFVPSAPAPAPYVSSFAASEPSTGSSPLNYMGSLGGGSAMKSGKNYSGVSNKFGPTKSNSYLDTVTSVAPATTFSSGSASVPVASGTSYLSALGGGSAMKSGKNYLGMSSSFGPTKSNSYLDVVASASAAVASSSAGVSSGPANYMSSLGGGSAMKSGKNYSGVSNKFAPTKSSSYIDQVATVTSVSSSATPASGVASGPLNYMGSLGGGGAMKAGKNYSGVSNKFGPTKSNSYLDQVAQAAPITSSYAASTPAAPVSNSLNYMGSLGGGSAMKSGKNFAGVSNKFGPVRSTNSYLDQVKNTVMQSSTYAPAAATPATSYTYSAPTPAPAAPAVPALNYMASLSGNANAATTVKKNYSGFGSTFASAKSGNSYLESVKNGAVQMAPPSYSTYNPMQAQAAAAVSSSYNSMQNSFAAATGQASYQQQQQQQQAATPAPASTSSYLSSL